MSLSCLVLQSRYKLYLMNSRNNQFQRFSLLWKYSLFCENIPFGTPIFLPGHFFVCPYFSERRCLFIPIDIDFRNQNLPHSCKCLFVKWKRCSLHMEAQYIWSMYSNCFLFKISSQNLMYTYFLEHYRYYFFLLFFTHINNNKHLRKGT